jgi:hypothetical protein
MGEYDKKPTKVAATAGPSESDRFGSGKVATNLSARIIKYDIVGGALLVTIASGTVHGTHANMMGYLKVGADGVLDFQITEAKEGVSNAVLLDAKPEDIQGFLNVVINPTSRPPQPAGAVPARVLAVEVIDAGRRITISKGAAHGIIVGTPGQLRSKGGSGSFLVTSTTLTRSKAVVQDTADFVTANPEIVLHRLPPIVRGVGAVQRRANGERVSAGDVQATAQAGVTGASSPLPYLDIIQRSFGKHDVSGVRAQIGGPATEASRALGARAYATGNTVAFASAPDLHTAAHEAAHTVQQARGAVGFQGLGAADDEHERHADAVADAVVAGRSAEALLDVGMRGGASSAVQLQPTRPDGFHQRSDRRSVFEQTRTGVTRSHDGFTGASLAVSRFGPIPPTARGDTATVMITVANMTSASVDVSGQIAVTAREQSFDKSAAFRIVSITPRHLEPDALAEVTIAFTPRTIGDVDAVLELSTSRDGLLSIPLRGRGVATDQERAFGVKVEAAKKKEAAESASREAESARREAESARRADEKKNADAFRKQVGPTVEVDVIETEDLSKERGLRYEQMCERALKLVGAGLRNAQLALSNFETVIRSPSTKETLTESAAKIIFSEIMKHHRDHVAAYLLKALPFGSEIGEYFAVASWSEAVGAERQRSKQAGEDHQAMRFLVQTREWFGQVHRKLDSNSSALVQRRVHMHESLDEAHQALDRNDIMIANERYDRDLDSGQGSIRGCFEAIVCEWTKQTKVPNSTRDAHVRILYDADWNLKLVSLEAIRGERLAEELTRDGREVDLHTLPIRRVVEWKPFLSRANANPLPHQAALFLSREIDGTGAIVETRFSELASRLKPQFEATVSSMRLPKVKELKGTRAR